MLLHDDEAGGATRIGDGTTTQTAAALLHPARFLLALLDNNNANNNAGVTVTIDVLTVVLVSSAACYGMCFRLARRKLQMLHAIQPQLTTKKLLLLSVLFSTVLRIMTILGVAAMNMANVRAHYSLQPSTSRHRYTGDKTQSFYDEGMESMLRPIMLLERKRRTLAAILCSRKILPFSGLQVGFIAPFLTSPLLSTTSLFFSHDGSL